jgi:predicted RNase H-like nuclease
MSEIVAGVDGCRGGWIVAVSDAGMSQLDIFRIEALDELFAKYPALKAVAVDMPIGLPERIGPRGRTPERLVRPLLGKRQSSVFSIPARSAVEAAVDPHIPEDQRFRHCCAIARTTPAEGKAVAKQAFGIFPKVVQLDRWLRSNPVHASRVYECHPEVSFWAMNGEQEVHEPKKIKHRLSEVGFRRRQDLLRGQGFDSGAVTPELARRLGAGLDDLTDACAACWTALRIAYGRARSFPDPPERDRYGLPIAIWA